MTKLLFAISFFSVPVLGQAAFVTGQIRNAMPGTPIDLLVPHRYIDGQDGHFRGMLDGQSRFSIEAAVPEPQLVFLIFNEDRLPVFLSNSDSLGLRADAFQFPLAVSFSGKAGLNNSVLQEYLRQNPLDFNEFNNIRFKIGQYWTAVETAVNDQMEHQAPGAFKAYLDSLKAVSIGICEKSASYNAQSAMDVHGPATFTDGFMQWLDAEITYFWAYHLLLYGHVYAGRYNIQPDFFDFLYEAPIICESIGSAWYRQFLLAFMARQQARASAEAEVFWAGQYQLAGKLLSGKPLAFFRSEMISTAFSGEKYRDLLPLYTHFLQTNAYPAYDEKVEGLYQKYARVLPGALAPDFEAADAEGKGIRLANMRGKVVYLNFWASWCGACLRKMEYMGEYEAELAAKGVEIVNVSIDQNTNHWRDALADRPFKGRHLLASAGYRCDIAALFGVEAIPQYFIIDRIGAFADKAATNQPDEIRKQLLLIAGK